MKYATPLFLAASLSLAACSAAAPHMDTQTVWTVTSSQSFEVTESQLREALNSRDLKLFTVVDHGAGAQSIGSYIGKSKLFIFGNPKSGTPLMQEEPKLGLELPMKILLHETDGEVHLHRTDFSVTVRAYGVADQGQRLDKISGTLDAIMDEAGGE